MAIIIIIILSMESILPIFFKFEDSEAGQNWDLLQFLERLRKVSKGTSGNHWVTFEQGSIDI